MKKKSGTALPTPKPVVLPLRKGAYISDFDTICGNGMAEDSLLDWAVAEGLNTLYYYDMSAILASSYAAFVTFYNKAKSRGIQFQSTQRASQLRLIGTPFNSTASYNTAQPLRKLGSGLENEFWNYDFILPAWTTENYANYASFPTTGVLNTIYVDDSLSNNGKYYKWIAPGVYIKFIEYADVNGNIIYRNWIAAQRAIYTYNKQRNQSSDVYIGQLHDYQEGTTPEQIALDMVQCTDRIYLSWYVTTAEFNSSDAGLNFVRTRINLLGEAAESIGKKIDILPIFAGTSEYMEAYFAVSGNTLLKAYNRALQMYNANVAAEITADAKLGINLKAGFQGYAIVR